MAIPTCSRRRVDDVVRHLRQNGLPSYLRQISRFPMLSVDAEQHLARRWRDHHDIEAAHTLVTSHLRLVAKIAAHYHRGYGLPVADLISEGNVGMLLAVKRFDPERGCRLTTYARWWIRAAMQEYILRSWSLVRMGTTAAQKKLFFNLRRLKGQMQAIDDGDMQPDQVSKISHMLVVPEREVINMNRRLRALDQSLNAPRRHDSDGEWQDCLVDEARTQESSIAELEEIASWTALLSVALNALKERERTILVERRLKDSPTTLTELSQRYLISLERIRQIEVTAFKKLQRAMNSGTITETKSAPVRRRLQGFGRSAW
jgi:RNA polymerase sigma-32 factor